MPLVAFFLLLVIAETPPAPADAPARRLDFLVGRWKQENRFPGALSGGEGRPGAGTVYCRWAVGGAWLLSEAKLDIPGQGPYEVLTAVTFDSKANKYLANSMNSLGAAVQYEGRWQDEGTLVFTAVGLAEGRRARVVYTKRADGSVGVRSEQATGDAPFSAYFESVMSRVPKE
jgi:hypothetical protein